MYSLPDNDQKKTAGGAPSEQFEGSALLEFGVRYAMSSTPDTRTALTTPKVEQLGWWEKNKYYKNYGFEGYTAGEIGGTFDRNGDGTITNTEIVETYKKAPPGDEMDRYFFFHDLAYALHPENKWGADLVLLQQLKDMDESMLDSHGQKYRYAAWGIFSERVNVGAFDDIRLKEAYEFQDAYAAEILKGVIPDPVEDLYSKTVSGLGYIMYKMYKTYVGARDVVSRMTKKQ